MSISEIEKDLKLLEQQLEEVETNISDSIERIEHKKQLERKIRKLKRSKSQIEQFEKEQQELKSLKSEFLLNNNETVDKKESEPDEPAEYTTSITDNSIATESDANVSEQIENNWNIQVDNTDSWPKNSDTTSSVTPISNKSKKSGKAWLFGGIVGFFILLGLVVNENKTNQTVKNNIKQQNSQPVKVEQSSKSLSSTQIDRQKDVTQNVSQANSKVTQRYPSSSNNKKTIVERKIANHSPKKNHQFSQPKSTFVAQQPSLDREEISDRKNDAISNTSQPLSSRNYMTLRRTEEANDLGNPLYELKLFVNGFPISSHLTVSGRKHTQKRDRDVSGTEAPLPNGKYTVAKNYVPGTHPEVGGRFLPIYPRFNTGRSALGIHYDPSYEKSKKDDGTAGSVALTNKEQLDKVLEYVRIYQPEYFEVQI